MQSKLFFAVLILLATGGQTALASEVNVYSYRQPFLVKPLFDAFTQRTGIKVNVVYAKKGLVERLKREGRNSPADLVFTVDIGRLTDVVNAGLAQPIQSPTITKQVPARFRDPNGMWTGLTSRARIIVTAKDRVKPGEITDYSQLADPQWRGRVCTRSGKHPYMVALTAAEIAHNGEAKAKSWLAGLKANLARRPQGNDRAQVKAIKEGVCDVAVINHYYIGKMIADPKQKAWADAVRIVFPGQRSHGTHVNLSGAVITKSAPHKAEAVKLLEFLVSNDGQRIYAERNSEYPVSSGVPWPELLQSWGKFKVDDLALAKVAQHRGDAIRLADEVGYDQ